MSLINQDICELNLTFWTFYSLYVGLYHIIYSLGFGIIRNFRCIDSIANTDQEMQLKNDSPVKPLCPPPLNLNLYLPCQPGHHWPYQSVTRSHWKEKRKGREIQRSSVVGGMAGMAEMAEKIHPVEDIMEELASHGVGNTTNIFQKLKRQLKRKEPTLHLLMSDKGQLIPTAYQKRLK